MQQRRFAKCKDCDGTGQVIQNQPMGPSGENIIQKHCKTCQGWGQVDVSPYGSVIEALSSSPGTGSNWEPPQGVKFDPTEAPVGSLEKVEVMRRRVEEGCPVFHPQDNRHAVLSSVAEDDDFEDDDYHYD